MFLLIMQLVIPATVESIFVSSVQLANAPLGIKKFLSKSFDATVPFVTVGCNDFESSS